MQTDILILLLGLSFLTLFLFITIRRTPFSTLLPYTTLFRSVTCERPIQGGLNSGLKATSISSRRLTARDRKSTRLNSSHLGISYAVFCLKKKTKSLCHTAFDECKTTG